jgi:hypothetical protein
MFKEKVIEWIRSLNIGLILDVAEETIKRL